MSNIPDIGSHKFSREDAAEEIIFLPVPNLQSRSELEQSKFRETLRAGSESDQVTFYA